MIKRVLDSKLPAIVYNPPKAFSVDYFKECSKAGALPVFDTELFETNEAIEKIKTLSEEQMLFGLRVNTGQNDLIEYLNNNFIKNLDIVVYSYNYADELLALKADNKYKIIVETVDVQIDEIINKVAPTALIIKGNEAPGKISKYTSYILLQNYIENTDFPVFVHGGVGQYTSAGMFAAGASGIVLDNQLYLSDEAPLSDNFKELLSKVEENDSTVIGDTLGCQYRFFSKLGTKIVKTIKEKESHIANEEEADKIMYKEITDNFTATNDNSANAMQSFFYLGQDAVFAKHFSEDTKKVSEIIQNLFKNVERLLVEVDEHDPLVKNASLAKEHGTKYPIIQGPMANICDNADFAKEVYEGGALPFFAMGSLPENLAENIIKEGTEKVKSFGCGLIGIEALNKSVIGHLDLIKKYKVPFALFAAGVPSQVNELEEAGTKTYLHTPSVKMMENGIKSGCVRFIFEGKEAGGHIGTLTSMVLWEMGIYKLKSQFHDHLEKKSIIFAGGVATKTGSSFVSGMASRLSKLGAKVGIQVGTSYLFSKEIVETGAIKELYQEILNKRNETIVTGATVGLTSRTLVTPFSKGMIEREHNRIKDGVSLNDRKKAFEHENIGSLLIGAKGVSLNFSTPGKVTLDPVKEEDHFEKGNFMSGDSLIFDAAQTTIKDIHERFISNKYELANNLNALEVLSNDKNMINDEIAVIGMGCVYPDASNIEEFWKNIVDKKYSIKEVPKDRVDTDLYFDEDRNALDKTYSKLGGIVTDFEFNYKQYGYSEEDAREMSRAQKMVLEAAFQAVKGAGYQSKKKQFPRKRTSVIIGSCLGNEYGDLLQFKYYLPEMKAYLDKVDEFKSLTDEQKNLIYDNLKTVLSPDLNPKHPTGAAINVEASRIALHLGLEGINYTVDAACATSFTAIDNARKELLLGDSDVVICGGVNTNIIPEAYVGFSQMGALSDKGSYPFDERANGFILGEGAGVFILKRMKDAIRDNDNIMAVLKGVGGSSDGKGKAIAAPQSRGQALAINRCYESMEGRITHSDINFIEAHGTSTGAGDAAELETLKNTYSSDNPIGISSVKSQIGHLLGGAGAAGMIKAILGINNKTLPPNGLFEKLKSKFNLDDSPFFIVKDAKEWKPVSGKERLAAVSSYGFGGINYHVVVGEYAKNYKKLQRKIFNNLDYDFNDDRIVVASLGCVLPGAQNTDELWDALITGEDQASYVPAGRFHNEYYEKEQGLFNLPKVKLGMVNDFKFNSLKFRIPPKTLRSIDRVQQFALAAATQAIEKSNLNNLLKEYGNRVGVTIGTSSGVTHAENIFRTRSPLLHKAISEISGLDDSLKKTIADKFRGVIFERYVENNEDTTPGLLSNIVSGRIANFYNCNGPNYIVESECASSAVAISAAIKDLKAKSIDFIITGGADTNIGPANLKAFQMIKVLAAEKNHFFDMNAQGLVMGEGAALMVLTTHKKAKENNMPILGEINGFEFQAYPNENMLAPTEDGFKRVINQFYKKNPISPKQVDYVDVFAASHKLVDGWEKKALASVYDNGIYFGNSKSEMTYFRAANPAVVIAKLFMMADKKQLLPNHSYNESSTIVEKDSPLKAAKEIVDLKDNSSVKLAANFSSLGGNVGHAVVSTIPAWMSAEGANIQTSEAKTAQPSAVASAMASVAKTDGKVVALLSGQGSQYGGMMKELYSSNQTIRAIMDQGEQIYKAERGSSLLEKMFGDNADVLNSTDNTQPAVFLSSAAIFAHLKSQGFDPDYFIGHSLGECTAMYASGVISFEDAMRLVCKRSELMIQAANSTAGQIMVLFKGADEAESLIKKSNIRNVYIANKNSGNQTAISGGKDEIDKFCDFLKAEGVMFKKLALSGAFHTPLFKSASDGVREFIKNISFNTANLNKIIANATADQYPANAEAAKDLLAKQIISSVEYVKSIEKVASLGVKHFIEVGPNKILINLLRNIDADTTSALPAVDTRKGEKESLNKLEIYLRDNNLIKAVAPVAPVLTPVKPAQVAAVKPAVQTVKEQSSIVASDDFNNFMEQNKDSLEQIMYKEFLKARKEQAFKLVEQRGMFTGNLVVAGTAIGLPGSGNRVFSEDNFDKLLSGVNCIEGLSKEEQKLIVDKNITRVFKDPQGNAKFVEITSTEDVVQLAGKLGYFDLQKDYGIDFKYDITYELAIAAGLEALKDAKIPLVLHHKKTSTGKVLPDGFSLPKEMQARTGVIFTSIFPGYETLINEVAKYYHDKFQSGPYQEFEKLYHFLMEQVKDTALKTQITDWFFKLKKNSDTKKYQFSRNLLVQIISLGSAHFAQIINAKGPNTQISSACASTTQAVGVAEDWIRMGRCDRVIIIGGESASSDSIFPWVSSGFLALGAASVKKSVEEAAKPFDEARNGMIVGSGAVAMIVERQDLVQDRGLEGQAEILGTYIGNSAFHVSKIDVNHLAGEMGLFMDNIEKIHGISKEEYTKQMVFMSHETYTPARGGSADAEVSALKTAFPSHYSNITITNSKGYTGHTLGAGIEDAVMVKALQKGIVPPIANLKNIPAHFSDLHFSKGEQGDYQYGFHLSAGFGSHFAFLFVKRLQEASVENNAKYSAWITRITNQENPELFIKNNTLCVESKFEDIIPNGVSVAVVKEEKVAPLETVSIPQVDSSAIKKIIAEQTGYTTDMLEDDLDLEADLGIDTVKQVEIFGKIAEHYAVSVPEDLKLSDLNTIQKLTEYMAGKSGGSVAPAAATQAAPVAQAAQAPAVDSGNILNKIKEIIAEQTGYTSDMLEDDLDLEADLGIDTVKQVEIFGKVSENFGVEVPEDLKLSDLNTIAKLTEYMTAKAPASAIAAAPAAAAAPVAQATGAGSADILDKVKAVIAEQTGYTTDMLEDDLDLEADLGIDTVKQVEIFGKVSENFGLEVPEDLKLSDLNTVAKLAEYIGSKASIPAAPAAAAPAQAAPQATSGTGSTEILTKVKDVIAEQTGYTPDMLEDDLDLEADLGIDTVKQVEIFGKVSENFGLEVPEDLKLSDLNTVAKLAEYIGSKASIPAAAPQPAAAAAPVQAAAPAGGTGNAEILTKVKDVIAEQTGYTPDMLEDDLDLEADLGIDTVKQVEIFGKVSENFGLEVPEDLKLSDLNTVAKLAEYIGAKASGSTAAPAAGTAAKTETKAAATTESDSGVKRFTVHTKKKQAPGNKENIFKGKTVIVSLDEHGFANKVIETIKANEGKVLTLANNDSADIKIDLTNLKSLEENMNKLAEKHTNIDGLIHLSPLNYLSKKQITDKEINEAIKSTFLFTKAFFNTLNKKGTLLSTISFDSIVFPYDKVLSKINPLFAGMCGLMKSINKELPETLVKTVDFSYKKPLEKVDEVVKLFTNELMSGTKEVEVGFKQKQRYVMSLKIESPEKGKSFVKQGGTLLVTGGARGITFNILKSVVKEYKTKLIILGRSDINNIAEEFKPANVGEAEIFKALKEKMQGSKPVEIKKAVAKVVRFKEAVANLEEIRSMGVEVDYHAVDVSDYKSVEAAVSKYDQIDGVLHAAGLEESQFIVKKELSSFNRVFDTKISGLLNLIKALKNIDYKFMSTFSSVTARFGNEGQADYTAANDMLGKMLQKEQLANPGKVYKTYDWTAWEGAGMATNPTVEKVLKERGLKFLPLEEGVNFFMDDLTDSKASEVLISGLDHDFDPDGLFPSGLEAPNPETPFLDVEIEKTDKNALYGRVLDLKRDLFLYDHEREGIPIFLGATGLESMAEAASKLVPKGHKFFEVSDFSIPYGIKILQGRPKEIMVAAETDGDSKDDFKCKIISQFKNKAGMAVGEPKLHYQANYKFVEKDPENIKVEIPEFSEVEIEGNFQDLIYHPQRLFMDGLFRTVEEMLSLDDNMLITKIRSASEREFFAGETSPQHITNVEIVDAMFQTGGMLEVMSTQDIILPYNIGKMRFYRNVEKYKEYICITKKTASDKDTNTYQLQLVDAEGNLYIDLIDFQMVKITKMKPEDQINDKIKRIQKSQA